jgi:hypothetical protein
MRRTTEDTWLYRDDITGEMVEYFICDFHAPDYKEGDCDTRDCHIDAQIYEIVMALWQAGCKSIASCEGGEYHGHGSHRYVTFPSIEEGRKAFSIAVKLGMDAYVLNEQYFREDEDGVLTRAELWFGLEPWARPQVIVRST